MGLDSLKWSRRNLNRKREGAKEARMAQAKEGWYPQLTPEAQRGNHKNEEADPGCH